MLTLTVVAGVVGFSRGRGRQRWEAAWEAYAAQEKPRGSLGLYEEGDIFTGRHPLKWGTEC